VSSSSKRAMLRMQPPITSQVTATFPQVLTLQDVTHIDGRCIFGNKDGQFHAQNGERITDNQMTEAEEEAEVKVEEEDVKMERDQAKVMMRFFQRRKEEEGVMPFGPG